MNTMYRNEKDKMNQYGGYEQVKKKFSGTGSEIFDKENFAEDNELQKGICELLKVEGEEENIKNKLNEFSLGLSSLKGKSFSEVKNTPSVGGDIKTKYENIMKVFDNMQKGALLHVHSTVGLNVENLFKLILEWNGNESVIDEMKIYYLINEQTVVDKTYINHTLMYKKQFTECKIDEQNIKLFSTGDESTLKPSLCFEETKGWGEFGKIFARTKSLFENKDFYYNYHKCFFEQCMENNIFYVEIRTGFEEFTDFSKPEHIAKRIIFLRPDFNIENYFYHENMLTDVSPEAPDIEFLKCIKKAKDDAVKSMKNKKPPCEKADNFNVKVILTANRNAKGSDVINNVVKK